MRILLLFLLLSVFLVTGVQARDWSRVSEQDAHPLREHDTSVIHYQNGIYRGTNNRGHAWTYNKRTGHYHNYGTGQMCNGRGLSRRCW